jgi:DNA-binding NarL/FixJ family response regulator
MIRVFTIDDHELIREGIKKILRSSDDMEVVGEAADLPSAIKIIAEKHPDVILLDLSLPEYDGIKAVSAMCREFKDIPLLVLSMFHEERYAVPALKEGAAGYITKAMAAEELVNAIRKIVAGGSYISPHVADLLASQIRNPALRSTPERLTERETQIVSLLGAGKQVKQIAAELEISISSVNTYRNRIFKKLKVQTNAALIRYAFENGLV